MDDLRQLMAAYFHQDWWDEHAGAWESAIDDFARREPHRVAGVREQIAALLDAADSDAAVGRALDSLGSYRDPGEAMDASSRWWREIRERLPHVQSSEDPNHRSALTPSAAAARSRCPAVGPAASDRPTG